MKRNYVGVCNFYYFIYGTRNGKFKLPGLGNKKINSHTNKLVEKAASLDLGFNNILLTVKNEPRKMNIPLCYFVFQKNIGLKFPK